MVSFEKDVLKLNHGDSQYFTIIADPRCLSRILIFNHPGSRSKESNKGRGVAKNFPKFKIILFWNAEDNNLDQFSKNWRTFYPKNFLDPGSGSKKAPDPEHFILKKKIMWLLINSKQIILLICVADPQCLSLVHPWSRIGIKEFKNLTPKKGF